MLATGGQAAESVLIAKVMAGELKEARASWWGFDKEDSTHALQAAIQSRVPRLIVDQMGSPWITDKLTCVSDQEIVFEKGVEVLAKQGLFMGKTDALFSLISVTNVTLRGQGATLRMRRADYDAPPYSHAEWRHVLNIKSSENINVFGLTLMESGGDGIYLGCVKPTMPNRNIHIKDVVCDKNYRQGISVISAENLLIEDTVMRNTAGTAPAAGIDFEPNHSAERLKNCVMRNCVAENNQGANYLFYLTHLNRTSEPVSIRLENCRSTGGRESVRIVTLNADEDAVRGELTFADCRFEKALRNGVLVQIKPAFGLALAFDRCVIAECAVGTNAFPDILLANHVRDEWPMGGLRLNDLTVIQPTVRPWLECQNNALNSETVAELTGTVTVEQSGARQTITLTPEWLEEMFPPRFPIRVPRVDADLAGARVIDRAKGLQKLSTLGLRFTGTYVFYAKMGEEAVLIGQQTQVAKYMPGTQPLTIRSLDGKVINEMPLPPFMERAEFRFLPDYTGFYTLEVNVGANAFTLLEANVPVAIDMTKKARPLAAGAGDFFAVIPQGTGIFAFCVAMEKSGPPVKATITDPSGEIVWAKDAITKAERFTATEEQGSIGGLWQMALEQPIKGIFENPYIDVLGFPGYLFLSRERYWEF